MKDVGDDKEHEAMSAESSQRNGDGPAAGSAAEQPSQGVGTVQKGQIRRAFTGGIGGLAAAAARGQASAPSRPTFTPAGSDTAGRAVTAGPGASAEDAVLDPTTVSNGPAAPAMPEPATVSDVPAVPTGPEPAAPSGSPAAPAMPAPRPGAGPQAGTAAAGVSGPEAKSQADVDGPLLSEAAGLRARWQRVQAGFVDDPQAAVEDAADLVDQTTQALVDALRQRQRQLRALWKRGAEPALAAADGESGGSGAAITDTEHLRVMVQRYRALFDELCRPQSR